MGDTEGPAFLKGLRCVGNQAPGYRAGQSNETPVLSELSLELAEERWIVGRSRRFSEVAKTEARTGKGREPRFDRQSGRAGASEE